MSMSILLQIRNLAVDRVDMDEAISAQAMAMMLLNEYKKLEVDPPDWLKAKTEEIQAQVKIHYRDFVARSARQARMKADQYQSREAKQASAEREAAMWEDKLKRI